MRVDFYHLTVLPLERVLPAIAQKVLDSGQRLLLVSDDAPQRAKLDQLLWTFAPESFLPHAQAGAGDDRVQPVLISDGLSAPNGARHVALADGAWRDAALDFDRVFLFFADDRIAAAREAWRLLQGREGVERHYWKQTDRGGWQEAG